MIKKEIFTALNLLEEKGYEAFLVGGAVRDKFLNRFNHGSMIATKARRIVNEVKHVNRVVYDIDNSVLKRSSSQVVTISDIDDDDVNVVVERPEEIRYLFTTKTCPNCKLAKQYLSNTSYIPIDAEENKELALKYKIRQAPTLVVVNGNESKKIANAANIRKYVEERELYKV